MLARLFFEMCATYGEASMLLYYEFPRHYTWVPVDKNWKRMKQSSAKVIRQMVSVLPNNSERFYLRILLPAAQTGGLLKPDAERHRCMEETNHKQMPIQIRHLFAIILVHCHPSSPKAL
ncbi:Helitron helicase [Phytophthora megakarya]|uniref:Helitron helicase n=1 Tax=Phytophthora megakarya TaxID=4795 RepID=A0A225WRR1_9STRA|nr:Helitron helicase [Phytophthora megakarya]